MAQRPFIDTFRDIETGSLLDDLTQHQHDVVEGVLKTMKQGTITVNLKYKYESDGQLSIESDIKSKVPQMPRGKSLFFTTPEGNLQRDNPRQKKLELQEVPTETQQLTEAV